MQIKTIRKILEDSGQIMLCVVTNARRQYYGWVEILDDSTIKISKDENTFICIDISEIMTIMPSKHGVKNE